MISKLTNEHQGIVMFPSIWIQMTSTEYLTTWVIKYLGGLCVTLECQVISLPFSFITHIHNLKHVHACLQKFMNGLMHSINRHHF